MGRFRNKKLKRLLQIIGIPETYSGNITNIIYNYYSCNLDFKQQELLNERKNVKNILQLVREIFNDMTIVEQSKQFKDVKKYLARPDKRETFEFTDEDLEFFFDKGEEMTVEDLIASRYKGEKPTERNAKCRYVQILLKVGNIEIYEGGEKETPQNEDKFTPPTKPQCVALINEIIGADVGEKYDLKTMNEAQREAVNLLKTNLGSSRFVAMINTFKRKIYRDVFLKSFIKATYDKPDLNEDESMMYLNLCKDYARELELRDQESELDEMIRSFSNDEDGSRVIASLSRQFEAVKKAIEDCIKRQTDLQNKLSGARSNRIKEMEGSTQSIASIIERVRDQDFREILMRVARAKELDTAQEMQNINDFDHIFAEVKGISRDEIINGL